MAQRDVELHNKYLLSTWKLIFFQFFASLRCRIVIFFSIKYYWQKNPVESQLKELMFEMLRSPKHRQSSQFADIQLYSKYIFVSYPSGEPSWHLHNSQPLITHIYMEILNKQHRRLMFLRQSGGFVGLCYFIMSKRELDGWMYNVEWDYDALILFQMLIYGFHKICFAFQLREWLFSIVQWLNSHGSATPRKLCT